MARARRAIGPAAARRLGGARRHDRARRGAQRALGPSRDRAAGGWWSELAYELGDLYPDAIACLEGVRALGLRVGIVGNQTAALERWARDAALPADVISSSASLGVRKPDPRSSSASSSSPVAAGRGRVRRRPGRQRRAPAAAAGLVAVHVRRGPWGRLQRTPPEAALGVDDLASLPEALASLL